MTDFITDNALKTIAGGTRKRRGGYTAAEMDRLYEGSPTGVGTFGPRQKVIYYYDY